MAAASPWPLVPAERDALAAGRGPRSALAAGLAALAGAMT